MRKTDCMLKIGRPSNMFNVQTVGKRTSMLNVGKPVNMFNAGIVGNMLNL